MPIPDRRRLILNPTLRLGGAVAELSRRGVGRARVELSDLRAVRFLVWMATGKGARPRLEAPRSGVSFVDAAFSSRRARSRVTCGSTRASTSSRPRREA